MTVDGDVLDVDYAGTSPQVPHGINSPMCYTYAYTQYPLKCALDPLTPKNEGSYRPLGVPSVVTRYDQDLAAQLRDRLVNRVSVLVGHSGVGKSTLVNALVPGAQRATAEVSEATGRGRHTSTQVVMLPLPFGGSIIDTPGIRSFGLAHVDADGLIAAFPDLEAET